VLLKPVPIRKACVLLLCVWPLMAWPSSLLASPVGPLPGPEPHFGIGMETDSPATARDPFHIVDQLESVGIDDRSFFDFSEDLPSGPESALEARRYAGGGSGFSVFGLDRATGFDRGMNFDGGTGFDKETGPDEKAGGQGSEFDKTGDFDKGPSLRLAGKEPASPSFFGREEKAPIRQEKEDQFQPRQEPAGSIEEQVTERDKRPGPWTGQKQDMKDLLRQEELEIESFKPAQTGLFIKIALFAMALFFLLAGMLKGLIPLRFYFFLTILILILWNPMESLFISIIIGLSALLAPLLG